VKKTCARVFLILVWRRATGVRVWSPKRDNCISDSLLVNSGEMREGLAIGFHAVTFLQYAFAVFYDYTYTIVPHNVRSVHNAYGGKFKFLTFWDAVSIDVQNWLRTVSLMKWNCEIFVLWCRYSRMHAAHKRAQMHPALLVSFSLSLRSRYDNRRRKQNEIFHETVRSNLIQKFQINTIRTQIMRYSTCSDRDSLQDPTEIMNYSRTLLSRSCYLFIFPGSIGKDSYFHGTIYHNNVCEILIF